MVWFQRMKTREGDVRANTEGFHRSRCCMFLHPYTAQTLTAKGRLGFRASIRAAAGARMRGRSRRRKLGTASSG